jgi:hypothetical protein
VVDPQRAFAEHRSQVTGDPGEVAGPSLRVGLDLDASHCKSLP